MMPTLFNQVLTVLRKGNVERVFDEAQTDAYIATTFVAFRLGKIKQNEKYVPDDEIELLIYALHTLAKEDLLLPEIVARLVTIVDLACLRSPEKKQTYLIKLDTAVKSLSDDAFKLVSAEADSATAIHFLASAPPRKLISHRTRYQLGLEKLKSFIEVALRDETLALTTIKKQKASGYHSFPKFIRFKDSEELRAYQTLHALIRFITDKDKKELVLDLEKHLRTLFRLYGCFRKIHNNRRGIEPELVLELLYLLLEKSEKILDKTQSVKLALQAYEQVYVDASTYNYTYKSEEYFWFDGHLLLIGGADRFLVLLDNFLDSKALIDLIRTTNFMLKDPRGDDSYYQVILSFLQGQAFHENGNEADTLYMMLQYCRTTATFFNLLLLSQHNLCEVHDIRELVEQDKPALLKPYLTFLNHFSVVNAKAEAYQQRNQILMFVKLGSKIQQFINLVGAPGIKYMQQLLANTVLPLEQMLEAMPLLEEALLVPLSEYAASHVKTSKSLETFTECLIAIEFIAAIKKDRLSTFRYVLPFDRQAFKKLIMDMAQGKTPQEFLGSLVRFVLNRILPDLDIEIDDDTVLKLFKRLPPDKLINLIAVSEKMQQDDYKTVYLTLLKMDLFGGNKDAFLHDPHQESVAGRELARHNQAIRNDLQKHGIIPEEALKYKKTYDFMLLPPGASSQVLNPNKKYLVLWNYLQSLNIEAQNAMKSKQTPDALKDKVNILLTQITRNITQLESKINKKSESVSGVLEAAAAVLSDKANIADPIIDKNIIRNGLDKLKAIEGITVILPTTFFEFADHTRDQFKLIQTTQASTHEAVKLGKDSKPLYISVEQWDKTKHDTFYLGDEVGCCLATNGAQFQAIVQRRMDDAMLFHVAIDKATGRPAALIWLYLAKTDDNKIVLMANFFEVNTKFGLNEYQRKGLLNGLLQFTYQYLADNPGIAGFYMNQLGYGWNKGDLAAYPVKPLALVDKVGGPYIPGEVSDAVDNSSSSEMISERQKLTNEKYYLVSLGQSSFHEFSPKVLADATKQENILVVSLLIQKTVVDILANKLISFDDLLVKVQEQYGLELEYFYDKPLEKNQRFLAFLENFYENAVIMQQTGGKIRSSVDMLKSEHAFFSRLNVPAGAASDRDVEVAHYKDNGLPDEESEAQDKPKSKGNL